MLLAQKVCMLLAQKVCGFSGSKGQRKRKILDGCIKYLMFLAQIYFHLKCVTEVILNILEIRLFQNDFVNLRLSYSICKYKK